MEEINKVKVKSKPGLEKVSILSKDKALTAIKFASDIKKGKYVPILKIQNINSFVKDLEKKNISKEERRIVLEEIYLNNKKRITELKNSITDRKNLKKQLKKSKKRNADGDFVFVAKYSQAELDKQQSLLDSARRSLSAASNKLAEGLVSYSLARNEYNSCKAKTFCNVKGKSSSYHDGSSIYSYYVWWRDTGIAKRRKALASAEQVKEAAYLKHQEMLRDNDDAIAIQQATFEEERARQEDLRREKDSITSISQAGLDEQILKLELAKQAVEILKLEKETKAVGEITVTDVPSGMVDKPGSSRFGMAPSTGGNTPVFAFVFIAISVAAVFFYFKTKKGK